MLLLALLSCSDPKPVADDSGQRWVPPGCGDGELSADEQCDDGEANSDSEPDACRSSCLLPSCGDAVADSGEACDDGGPWGGDGCTPTCTAEAGQLESEPNDSWDDSNAWEGGEVDGALPEGDTDCYSLELEACSAIEASLVGTCPAPATLSLHDPDGNAIAVGTPDEDGCAALDPATAPGARFVAEGPWAVCVSGLLGGVVPYYALDVVVVDPEDAAYEVDEGEDPDGDGRPDRCDDDRDGDGVLDDLDNCPDTPNGPDMAPLAVDDLGFIRTWLAAGPFDGTASTESCRPSDDDLVADSDALVQPALGDAAGDQTWTALFGDGERVDFMAWATVGAPREVYQAVYLYNPSGRALTLAIGPDDGARVWLDTEQVLDISGCQGTTVDQFTADVDLEEGWHSLVIKVRDQGGAWGNYTRFLDADGEPVTDIELSLSPDGPWVDDQGDLDGDGTGDVCDPTPAG